MEIFGLPILPEAALNLFIPSILMACSLNFLLCFLAMRPSWLMTVCLTCAIRLNLDFCNVALATDTFWLAEGTPEEASALLINTLLISCLMYWGRWLMSSSLISPPWMSVLNSSPLWSDTGRKGLSLMTPKIFRTGKLSPFLTALLEAFLTSTWSLTRLMTTCLSPVVVPG